MADNFHHMADLDSRYARKIDPGMPLVPHTDRQDAHVDFVYELLLGLGAPPTCHVISASSELDANEVALRTALEQVIGWHDGTFLSCLPGRLAYFEGEGLNQRYILER